MRAAVREKYMSRDQPGREGGTRALSAAICRGLGVGGTAERTSGVEAVASIRPPRITTAHQFLLMFRRRSRHQGVPYPLKERQRSENVSIVERLGTSTDVVRPENT